MAKRFFISDIHFNSSVLIDKRIRPFKTVERMNDTIIKNINQRCKSDDILISLGDVYQYGNDRQWQGEKIHPSKYLYRICPTFINIRGNHDDNNKIKSVCDSMRTSLGKKYTAVSISHYPSNHPKSLGTFHRGDIRLHGHIHSKIDKNGNIIKPPKFFVDFDNEVLNINLNCELWNYNPVSEDELIQFIDSIMRNNGKFKK